MKSGMNIVIRTIPERITVRNILHHHNRPGDPMIKGKSKVTDGITDELLNFDVSDDEIDIDKLQKELNHARNN